MEFWALEAYGAAQSLQHILNENMLELERKVREAENGVDKGNAIELNRLIDLLDEQMANL